MESIHFFRVLSRYISWLFLFYSLKHTRLVELELIYNLCPLAKDGTASPPQLAVLETHSHNLMHNAGYGCTNISIYARRDIVTV